MFRMRTILTLAALAFGLAACANNSSSSAGAGGLYGGGASTPTTVSSGAATVATAKVGDLGTVLVNGDGSTLYLFEADTGSTSNCAGACAGIWPPLTTSGAATGSMGASSSMLGTTTRADGTTQVTYNGHPVYLYSGDTAAGQANGEGINHFGGLWYAVSTAGTAAMPSGSGSGGNGGGNGNGSGGGGYGSGGYG
jgi:predicted lipoprotein with Yx(FWY)xxD motif